MRRRVGVPDSADGERRRRTIESLRHVERELERARTLLDDVLRRAGRDPEADDGPGAPPAQERTPPRVPRAPWGTDAA